MKIAHLTSQDWEALYIDGEKVMENHTLMSCEILDILSQHGVIDLYSEWIEEDEWEAPDQLVDD